ncbi:hypothetical protein HC928_03165 [bacterium]|nr:hypothetical protein [bacterium]
MVLEAEGDRAVSFKVVPCSEGVVWRSGGYGFGCDAGAATRIQPASGRVLAGEVRGGVATPTLSR